MFFNEYPVFERGRILKLEMLENIRDYPRDLMAIYYQNYANGIVTGCNLQTSDTNIMIKPGIICFNHQIYRLKESVKIPYKSSDKVAVLKVKFIGEDRQRDAISQMTQITIDYETTLRDNEIELCRFKLQEGARLRSECNDLEAFKTEYDVINIIHAPYAAEEESTIAPSIINTFATEAFNHTIENPLDISFCMQCMAQAKNINRKMILSYIAARLHYDTNGYTNEQIYDSLQDILTNIKHGEKTRRSKDDLSHKIWID